MDVDVVRTGGELIDALYGFELFFRVLILFFAFWDYPPCISML